MHGHTNTRTPGEMRGEERAESSSDPYEDFPSSSELARHDYLENLP